MNTHHPDRLTDAAGVRILLYGDVDLNVIDGSATWLPSLAAVSYTHLRAHET